VLGLYSECLADAWRGISHETNESRTLDVGRLHAFGALWLGEHKAAVYHKLHLAVLSFNACAFAW
jgi:hypothetical protein